jgi:hypothetical protein
MRLSLNFDQTHAATADWLQSAIIAQDGNIKVHRAANIEDGEAFMKPEGTAVDCYFNHSFCWLNCSLRQFA